MSSQRGGQVVAVQQVAAKAQTKTETMRRFIQAKFRFMQTILTPLCRHQELMFTWTDLDFVAATSRIANISHSKISKISHSKNI